MARASPVLLGARNPAARTDRSRGSRPAFQRMLGGEEFAGRASPRAGGRRVRSRHSRTAADEAAEILALDGEKSAWEETLACEPIPRSTLEGEAIDSALAAMGDFADLVSPYLVGHTAGVAELAAAAAQQCGFETADRVGIRRAALVHDLGRVVVPVRIWQKAAPLTSDDWERVRLHAYHSERLLSAHRFLPRRRQSLPPTMSDSMARAITEDWPPRHSRRPLACSPPPTPITR